MARLILNQGDSVGLSAGNFDPIAGTVAGAETITLTGGTAVFDPSFNAGGDTIRVAGAPGDYTIVRSGSSAVMSSASLGISVTIPVGTVGLNVVFLNGAGAGDDDARTLVFDTVDNRIELGGNPVTTTPTVVAGPATPPPPLPTLTVSNAAITEGDAGTSVVTFTLTLGAAAATAVTANFSTVAGTATANSDFVPTAGTVTFAPGQTVATVSVPVIGDTVQEAIESFSLSVTSTQATVQAGGGIATITDNDTQSTFTLGQDVLTGGAVDDAFFAFNNNLNAGDNVNGGEGNDTLNIAVDSNASPGQASVNYAGFVLTSVENVVVTNDSVGRPVNIDLSGTSGINRLVSSNSSSSVAFNQIPNLAATIEVDTLTNTGPGTTANVNVQFQDKVVTGANDTATVRLSNSTADSITIGRVSDANGGVENVILDSIGNSGTKVGQLDTDLTKLTITGNQALSIDAALNATTTTVDASVATGALTLSTANSTAGQAVAVTGSQGTNNLTGGTGNENVTTFSANDTINVAGGNNTVSAGQGNNTVTGGDGVNTVTSLDGNDTVTLGNGGNTVNAGNGNNTVSVGTGIDDITTGSGNDAISGGGGNDIIRSGAGTDFINISGIGRATLDSGEDDDTAFAGINFDAQTIGVEIQDKLTFGSGKDELQISASTADANFRNVNGLEVLTLTTAGTTAALNNTNGTNGDSLSQAAGLEVINLSAGNDIVDTADFTRGLTFNATTFAPGTLLTAGVARPDFTKGSGGTDVVTGGVASDIFNAFGTMDDSDVLIGNLGSDTLNLDGSTTLTTASQFTGIETINLQTGRDGTGTVNGNVYSLTLDDSNAPTGNGVLSIDGSGLTDDPDGPLAQVAETANVDTVAVTAFDANITTGAANDTVNLGPKTHTVTTGAGDDLVTSLGVATLGRVNTINTGLGNDFVNLGGAGGKNVVSTGNGVDYVQIDTLGGIETIDLGDGDDAFDLSSGASVLSALAGDTVAGGIGTDTAINSNASVGTDGFAALSSVEQVLNEFGGAVLTLGTQGQAAGVVRIIDGDAGATSTYDASLYTSGITVNLEGGSVGLPALAGGTINAIGNGNDVVKTGSGDDVVTLGTGDNIITLGDGADRVEVQGAELTIADKIAGGTGEDTVLLDNRTVAVGVTNAVTAVVDLDNVTSIETFSIAANGQRDISVVDVDNNSLTFKNGTIGSLTTTTISAAALTDADDSFTLILDPTQLDADYAFTLLGAGAGVDVILEKQNKGTNNNIDFQGAASDDVLRISGDDLGSTVRFFGSTGTDAVEYTGGRRLTDDAFLQVDEIEILGSASPGQSLAATLGSTAASSDIQTIRGSAASDDVVFDAGFGRGVSITLGNGGDDAFNAAASAAAFTFNATAAELTKDDKLSGGSSNGDAMNIALAATAASDITAVVGVETINVQDKDAGASANVLTLTLDTAAAEVAGGTQTINTTGALGLNDATPGDVDSLVLAGAAATAALIVNTGLGNDIIATGSGKDQVNAGAGNNKVTTNGGQDTVTIVGDGNNAIILGDANDDTADLDNSVTITGNGTNVVYGDTAIDAITIMGSGTSFIAAGAGADTVIAGSGNDLISGGDGNDTINAGAGADRVFGGAGKDTITLGAGADVLVYGRISDSSTSVNRDVIADFASGTDKIDVRGILTASGAAFADGTLSFVGNFSSFGQSQGAIQAGGDIEVVYQQDDGGVLWFDLDNNGQLDGNDLQIVLGVGSVAAADIVGIGGLLNAANAAGQFVADFDVASAANAGFASNINYF